MNMWVGLSAGGSASDRVVRIENQGHGNLELDVLTQAKRGRPEHETFDIPPGKEFADLPRSKATWNSQERLLEDVIHRQNKHPAAAQNAKSLSHRPHDPRIGAKMLERRKTEN